MIGWLKSSKRAPSGAFFIPMSTKTYEINEKFFVKKLDMDGGWGYDSFNKDRSSIEQGFDGSMKNFRERKQERTKYYFQYVYMWKERPCTACNGSGYYDSNGSPECGCCDGTGKETYNSQKEK